MNVRHTKRFLMIIGSSKDIRLYGKLGNSSDIAVLVLYAKFGAYCYHQRLRKTADQTAQLC